MILEEVFRKIIEICRRNGVKVFGKIGKTAENKLV